MSIATTRRMSTRWTMSTALRASLAMLLVAFVTACSGPSGTTEGVLVTVRSTYAPTDSARIDRYQLRASRRDPITHRWRPFFSQVYFFATTAARGLGTNRAMDAGLLLPESEGRHLLQPQSATDHEPVLVEVQGAVATSDASFQSAGLPVLAQFVFPAGRRGHIDVELSPACRDIDSVGRLDLDDFFRTCVAQRLPGTAETECPSFQPICIVFDGRGVGSREPCACGIAATTLDGGTHGSRACGPSAYDAGTVIATCPPDPTSPVVGTYDSDAGVIDAATPPPRTDPTQAGIGVIRGDCIEVCDHDGNWSACERVVTCGDHDGPCCASSLPLACLRAGDIRQCVESRDFCDRSTTPSRCIACGRPGEICCPDRGCDAGTCIAGRCEECGDAGEACCTNGNPCGSGMPCQSGMCPCGGLGNTCCPDGSCGAGMVACQGGRCVACGGVNQPCCAGACSSTATTCVSNACVPCGGLGQPCCAGGCSAGGTACAGNTCVPCGDVGQPCCGGGCSNPNAACNGSSCIGCGGPGQPCCGGNRCNDTSTVCAGGSCAPCGGQGQICCDGFSCRIGGNWLCAANGYCFQCGGPCQPCCGAHSSTSSPCNGGNLQCTSTAASGFRCCANSACGPAGSNC